MKRTLGELELLILLALARLGPAAYGVSIGRAIAEAGGGPVSLSSIYAALERLEAAGLVGSTLGEATAERGGRAKRYFQITEFGWQRLRSTRETLVSLWQDIPGWGGIA
jgi:PadR family transcriptional regulator, regulatory protein PadR